MPDPRGRVTVVGVLGDTLDSLGEPAIAALRTANTVAGGNRHMSSWREWQAAEKDRNQDPAASRHVREIIISDDATSFARAVAGASRVRRRTARERSGTRIRGPWLLRGAAVALRGDRPRSSVRAAGPFFGFGRLRPPWHALGRRHGRLGTRQVARGCSRDAPPRAEGRRAHIAGPAAGGGRQSARWLRRAARSGRRLLAARVQRRVGDRARPRLSGKRDIRPAVCRGHPRAGRAPWRRATSRQAIRPRRRARPAPPTASLRGGCPRAPSRTAARW